MGQVITVHSSNSSTGPLNIVLPSGTGTGYYDGLTNSGFACGSTTPTNSAFAPTVTFAGTTVVVDCIGEQFYSGTSSIVIVMAGNLPRNFFTNAQVTISGTTYTFNTLTSTTFNQIVAGSAFTVWTWLQPVTLILNGVDYDFTFNGPLVPGHGDITDPFAWEDTLGNIPPAQFSNVPATVNFPLTGDGRYWFQANANAPNLNSPIVFIGDPSYYSGLANLQWSITQAANDGSGLTIAYSLDGGATWITTVASPQQQLHSIQNGQIIVNIQGATGLQVQVYSTGGTASASATLSQVAIAITRNANEGLSWDNPNPFDPINYNAQCMDSTTPTATMSSLSARILVRLGFANQATNPPPGMALLVQDFLTSAQTYLYRRYLQLHTKRFFRWKVNPGQRFYSLKDNDEDVLCGFQMDPVKSIEWAGIQDTRNVWYPLIQGIPPQLYTMVTKPWRPARYDIRQAIELYPAPDQTYWLWMKGHFGLMSFVAPTDSTTLDAELVFLHALANAKAHYGQPDANNVEAQANAYRAELIAGTHQTAHYLPGTIAVPPAVRPTLIQFDSSGGGG